MLISRQSILSGKHNTKEIPIHLEHYHAWMNGMHIQDAAPYLSDSDREFLISGISDDEWEDAMFEEPD